MEPHTTSYTIDFSPLSQTICFLTVIPNCNRWYGGPQTHSATFCSSASDGWSNRWSNSGSRRCPMQSPWPQDFYYSIFEITNKQTGGARSLKLYWDMRENPLMNMFGQLVKYDVVKSWPKKNCVVSLLHCIEVLLEIIKFMEKYHQQTKGI